jgi:hypothetical protein
MSRNTPRVSEAALYAPDLPDGRIRLDSAAWFAWLEQHSSSSFSYPLFDPACGYIIGFMTVRKEGRRRGGRYWTVYRRQGRRLRKIYLGPSAHVTAVRLAEVAERLVREGRAASTPERPE